MSPSEDHSLSSSARAAVRRARWAVVQTGLITTGLTLFGVHVTANRINDVHVMTAYAWTWFPAGPIVIGLMCGIGYLLAAWWTGVHIDRRLLALILTLQIFAYFLGEYTDFDSIGLVYRGTNDPYHFWSYFHAWTLLYARYDGMTPTKPLGWWGYLLRAGELSGFILGGLMVLLASIGRTPCAACGGALKRQLIGTLPGNASPELILRLQNLAKSGKVTPFNELLHANEPAESPGNSDAKNLDLFLHRCSACGNGYMESTDTPSSAALKRTEVAAAFADAFMIPAASPAAHHGSV